MAGVKGKSGGGNRISAAEHVIRGTFRQDRHGSLVAPMKSAAVVMRALEVRAEEVEALGMKLIDRGAAARLVKTNKNGPQMDPRFMAGLRLVTLANDLWDTWERFSRLPVRDPGNRPPPDSLDAFRKLKDKWKGLL